MGVSSIQNRVTLAGDGVATVFSFPYYFFHQSDLYVYVYDTLLGGVVGPYLLNTDYTISGTQNYQGLYQSGGAVTFLTYVPLATDLVIILRSPIEQQNFSLLQGGTISSAALVQQLDYLTLLIQRLQDEVSRCIQIPDGVGASFSGQLPTDVALSPGLAPAINPSGDGWDLVAPGAGPPGPVGPAGPAGSAIQTVVNGGNAAHVIAPADQHTRAGSTLTAIRTYTLPAAASIGEVHTIKNPPFQTFSLSVAANGGDLIDGLTAVTVFPNKSLAVICGAAGVWDII